VRLVIIREARPDEHALVGELRVAAYRAGGLLPESTGYAGTLRAFGFGGDCAVLVAEDGSGRVVGTITLEPFGPDSELARDETEADIRAFAVDARAQGQGVGGELLRAVTEHAARRGVRRLRLCTQPAMAAAQHLYAAAGFTRTPDLDFEPARGVALRAYELALPPGALRRRLPAGSARRAYRAGHTGQGIPTRMPGYEGKRFMTTLAGRPNAALLVIDAQNGVLAATADRDSVLANIGVLVARARSEGAPVIWVQHADDGLPHGSDGWQLVPEVSPLDGEPVVHKAYGDSFEGTDLEELLASRAVGRLVVAGAQSDACVRATIHGAFTRGYDVTLVSDAHTTGDRTEYGGPRAGEVIAHTNLYWSYQSAPGRTALTVPTPEVSFAPYPS
jgi:ribosomal protein S18 acetylase RimI-like enzyme/isochorismate hydrolase